MNVHRQARALANREKAHEAAIVDGTAHVNDRSGPRHVHGVPALRAMAGDLPHPRAGPAPAGPELVGDLELNNFAIARLTTTQLYLITSSFPFSLTADS